MSARGLVEGLGSLAAGGLSPQLLIIDDGWQVRGRLLHDWRCVHFIRAFFHIYAASAEHRQLAGESAPAALFLLSSYVCSFVRCVVPVYDNHVCYVSCLSYLANALFLALLLLLLLLLLQLTDVDPPYGKAPTAQLADKLAGEGTAAAQLFDGPREMVLETQVRRRACASRFGCCFHLTLIWVCA